MKIIVEDENSKIEKVYINPSFELIVCEKKTCYNNDPNLNFIPVRVNDDYYGLIYNDGGKGILIDLESNAMTCWNITFHREEKSNFYLWYNTPKVINI